MTDIIGKILGKPNLESFDIVADFYSDVKFVCVPTDYTQKTYKIIGEVTRVEVSNPFFEKPSDLRYTVEGDQSIISRNFYIFNVNILGVIEGNNVEYKLIPPLPGSDVYPAEEGDVKRILKIADDGIEIGFLKSNAFSVKIYHSKLMRTHSAIIGQTGSGKSYFAAKLAIELLKQKDKSHVPAEIAAPVIFDTSGEYSIKFASTTDKAKIALVLNNVSVAEHSLPLLNEKYLWLLNEIYELDHDIGRRLTLWLRGDEKINLKKGEKIGQERLFDSIDSKEDNSPLKIGSTKQLSIRFEKYLQQQNRISQKIKINIPYKALAKMDKMNLKIKKTNDMNIIDKMTSGLNINIGEYNDLEEKQIIMKVLLNQIINAAKNKKLKSRIALFIDEAHNYVPSVYKSFCKNEILTIAREGRKYGLSLCLISQRPRWVDPTALSQCGNIFIFRIQNSDDLKHIFDSASLPDSIKNARIPRLHTGEVVIAGDVAENPMNCQVTEIDTNFIDKKRLGVRS